MVLHYRHRFDDGFYSLMRLGFPKYAISKDGVIRTNFGSNRIVKVGKNRHGDLQVQLTNEDGVRKNVKLDKLIAEAFVEKSFDNKAFSTVIHKNGDKTDNRISNLVWRSRSYAHLYYKRIENPGHYADLCYITAYNHKTRETKRYMSVVDAAKDFGVYPQTMSALCEPQYYEDRSVYVDRDWEFKKQTPDQF